MTAASYERYLRSAHWLRVKQDFAQANAKKCAICSSKRKLHLHHRTYERLGNERLSDLIYLCEKHHSRTHALVAMGMPLWDAHCQVDSKVLHFPPSERPRRKAKQKKQRVRSSKPPQAAKPQLFCQKCSAGYSAKHPFLKCKCGGAIKKRSKKEDQHLLRRFRTTTVRR